MKTLRNREVRELIETVEEIFDINAKDIEINNKSRIYEDEKILFVNNKPCFFYLDKKIVPTLKLMLRHKFLKEIVVDMGAVRFVINGADVMRPGIKHIEEGIKKEDFVVIVDETHKKPLAIGVAAFDSEEMKKLEKGKVIENLHHVGDEIWGK